MHVSFSCVVYLLTIINYLIVCSTHVIHHVYTQKLVGSDKFKTGKDQYIDRSIVSEDNRDIIIRRIPVMVKSDLCWMKEADKGDCDFDHEGYFLVKGEEKVSLNNSF
jgi:DNA-directed RNA polymerase-4/5 subunit 2